MEDYVNITDLNMKCPVCHKGKLLMIYKVTKIPHFGGILITTIKCSFCSFKVNDIYAISEKGDLPEIHKIKTLESHLGDLLVLSGGSKVVIPELEYEVDIYSELGGEITTVEGILREALELFKTLLKSETNINAKEKLKKLRKIVEEELNKPSGTLTIIVIDKRKRSTIIPVEIWSERVEKERVASIPISREELEKIGKEIVKKYLEERAI